MAVTHFIHFDFVVRCRLRALKWKVMETFAAKLVRSTVSWSIWTSMLLIAVAVLGDNDVRCLLDAGEVKKQIARSSQ